jgi:hypothetical protein
MILAAVFLLISTVYAVARDVAIIADDQHRQDIMQVLDAALKNQGINILPQVNRVIEILQKANTVVEQKDDSTAPKSNKGIEHKD